MSKAEPPLRVSGGRSLLIGIGATFFSIASCFSVIAVVAIILSIVLFYMIPETRGKEF